jgi:hypothetical protein
VLVRQVLVAQITLLVVQVLLLVYLVQDSQHYQLLVVAVAVQVQLQQQLTEAHLAVQVVAVAVAQRLAVAPVLAVKVTTAAPEQAVQTVEAVVAVVPKV